MRKINLRQSTKILFCILVFVISVGGTLAVIYRDKLFAQNIPETNDNTPSYDEIPKDNSRSYYPPNENKSTWKPDKLDSGGRFFLSCASADIINNTEIQNDMYKLNIDWVIDFKAMDNEYLKWVKFYVIDDDSGSMTITDQNVRTITAGKSIYKTDSQEITLALNTHYRYILVALIANITQTPLGYLWSNECQAYSTENPEETIGGQGEVVAGGANLETTKDGGSCYAECPGILSPVKNALCNIKCAVLDMFIGFFDLAFRLLEGAVGLS